MSYIPTKEDYQELVGVLRETVWDIESLLAYLDDSGRDVGWIRAKLMAMLHKLKDD